MLLLIKNSLGGKRTNHKKMQEVIIVAAFDRGNKLNVFIGASKDAVERRNFYFLSKLTLFLFTF